MSNPPRGTMPGGGMNMGPGGMGMPGMMGMPMMGMMGMPMMGMPMMGMPMMGMNAQGRLRQQAQSGGMMTAPSGAVPAQAGPVASSPATAAAKKEHLLHDLEVAAHQLQSQREDKRDRSRSRDDDRGRGGAAGGASKDAKEEREKTPPRCHLHPAKKPNAKCKFCQRAQQAANQKGKADEPGKDKEESSKAAGKEQKKVDDQAAEEEEDYSRRSFNCSPMLKDQILGASYFKSLLKMTTIEELTEEITNYADTLDVYNPGSNTAPSCFICQVYRLFTLPEAEDMGMLQVILDSQASPIVRCAGFLYMRFVVPPQKIFEKLEEYLFDDTSFKHQAPGDNGKQVTTTIGEYVEALMIQDKYFGRPIPRIPIKVKQQLEKELAPIGEYRKRMKAHDKNGMKKIAGTPVEVVHGGAWVKGTAMEYSGKVVKAHKVKVEIEGGEELNVHMGKVILADGKEENDEEKDKPKAESESEEEGSDEDGKRKRRKRSRSRRRAKSASPDWCRYKGNQDKDHLEAMREKVREEAVCAYGKSYSKRPYSVEEELWKRDDGKFVASESRSGGKGSSRARQEEDERAIEEERKAKMRREDEEEHRRRMRDIYEKYGSAKTSAYSSGGSSRSEVDQPDILRLG